MDNYEAEVRFLIGLLCNVIVLDSKQTKVSEANTGKVLNYFN